MRPRDRFGEQARSGMDFNFLTAPFQRKRIGDDQLIDHRLLDAFVRAAGQDRVRAGAVNLFRAIAAHCLCRIHKRPARVDEVVDNEYVLSFHVADDIHDFCLVGLGTALVDQDQFAAQPLCI